ncbi:metallophosphoesterase [Haloplanus aerogenes]|uniref:Metallophosphoesterase n=1 Tax=Haloplanus aerogenes TaxID=660522 RepID=A0A3M0CZI6_9EURY|nr:metallophosphoesterase [Haloplanus aerogenes]AZH25080.1 metallophosphoesterase [Haloplanus aerogenes]RMB13700.1 putative phosphoesterase [Haloplanus aerogenes]
MTPPDTYGRTVFLPAAATLVVADLHAGRATATNAGILLDERQDLLDRLTAAMAAMEPETVVFAGDLCHRFGAPSDRTAGTIRALAGAVRAAGARPVAVAGNHDGGLAGIWPGPVHDAYRLPDGTLVCHGHEAPETDAERYVCGHLHPAIEMEGRKRDCFLWTAEGYRDRPTLVLPAFSTFAAGLRIERRDAVDSPLVPDLDAVRPGVIDRTDDGAAETLWFPPLADLRPYLRR